MSAIEISAIWLSRTFTDFRGNFSNILKNFFIYFYKKFKCYPSTRTTFIYFENFRKKVSPWNTGTHVLKGQHFIFWKIKKVSFLEHNYVPIKFKSSALVLKTLQRDTDCKSITDHVALLGFVSVFDVKICYPPSLVAKHEMCSTSWDGRRRSTVYDT